MPSKQSIKNIGLDAKDRERLLRKFCYIRLASAAVCSDKLF
jgi:hypothetical protein